MLKVSAKKNLYFEPAFYAWFYIQMSAFRNLSNGDLICLNGRNGL